MGKKRGMNMAKQLTKEKLLKAAWVLFSKNGYEQTTLTDIIKEADSSRGAFYHHFRSKEDLLFNLVYFFDKNYDEWMDQIDPDMNALDKLYLFDKFILENLENSPYRSLLPELYGYQVMTSGTKYVLNPDRSYYTILNQIVREGIRKNEILSDFSCSDIVHTFANLQHSYTYNWCLEKFHYSLYDFAHPMMKLFLDSIRPS